MFFDDSNRARVKNRYPRGRWHAEGGSCALKYLSLRKIRNLLFRPSGGCQHVAMVTWALRFVKDSNLCRFPLGVSHLTWNATCNVLTLGKSCMGESLVTPSTLAIDTRGTVSATGSFGRISTWNRNKFMNMLIAFTTVEAQRSSERKALFT